MSEKKDNRFFLGRLILILMFYMCIGNGMEMFQDVQMNDQLNYLHNTCSITLLMQSERSYEEASIPNKLTSKIWSLQRNQSSKY